MDCKERRGRYLKPRSLRERVCWNPPPVCVLNRCKLDLAGRMELSLQADVDGAFCCLLSP